MHWNYVFLALTHQMISGFGLIIWYLVEMLCLKSHDFAIKIKMKESITVDFTESVQFCIICCLWARPFWAVFNSLAPGRSGKNSKSVISEHMLRMECMSTSCEIALSQHWFRSWLGAIRQQGVTWSWASVDPYLCSMLSYCVSNCNFSLSHQKISFCYDFTCPGADLTVQIQYLVTRRKWATVSFKHHLMTPLGRVSARTWKDLHDM